MTSELQHFREQACMALAPFFVEGANGDMDAAQTVAGTMVDSYSPVTPKEMQLSAQIVAFGFAAMACLRSAMAAKNLPIDDVLALQDAAISLDKLAQKATKELETRRKERARAPRALTAEATQWDAKGFNAAMAKALDKMQLADGKIAELLARMRPKPKKPNLRIVSSEPMTQDVLKRLAKPQAEPSRPRPVGPQHH